jgi:ribosomal protein S27E
MNEEDILRIGMSDLSFVQCTDCENYFFVHEMPMGINNPVYCAYCGIEFNRMIDDGTYLL